jgi:hypothetical protein
MEERIECAADFLRKDMSGTFTSSQAMQYAGFSATELRDRNLQRKVLRKKNSSPEVISVAIPSTEHIQAKENEISPMTLASTASTTIEKGETTDNYKTAMKEATSIMWRRNESTRK